MIHNNTFSNEPYFKKDYAVCCSLSENYISGIY